MYEQILQRCSPWQPWQHLWHVKWQQEANKSNFLLVSLGLELFFSAWWIKLWRICWMKMLYFKALGNQFKKAVEPLNAAKSDVLSASNSTSRWTMQWVNHILPNLRFRKPLFGKSCGFSEHWYTRKAVEVWTPREHIYAARVVYKFSGVDTGLIW